MSQVAVHHPSSYAFSGQMGLPATVTAAVSATFSWKQLDPSTGHTVVWGDATGNGSFTSDASGNGSLAHTYASNGTYTQVVTETATGQTVAKRTFTVPYAGGAGFAPRLAKEPTEGGTQPAPQSLEQRVEDLESAEVPVGFDPGAHTVAEVEAYVDEHPDQAQELLDAETVGKNRSSLVVYLESLVPFDPGEYNVTEVEEYAADNPDQLEDVIAAEEAGKARVTLLNHLYSLRP